MQLWWGLQGGRTFTTSHLDEVTCLTKSVVAVLFMETLMTRPGPAPANY